MKGLMVFRGLLVLATVGFLTLVGVACSTDIVYGFLETWDTLWGRVIVADLGFALALFASWALWRDGWLKGLAWTLAFVVLGSAGVAVYALWNLRGVQSTDDMARFFMGRHSTAPVEPAPAAIESPAAVMAAGVKQRPATA